MSKVIIFMIVWASADRWAADAFAAPQRWARTSTFFTPSTWSSSSNSCTQLNLFFTEKKRVTIDPPLLPQDILDDLQSPSLELPYRFRLDGRDLTVRFLEKSDLKTVVPMCVREFGTGTSHRSFPWGNLNRKSIENWFDSVLFGPLVGLSLSMKIVRREKGYDQSAPEVDPDHNLLCLEDESGRAVAIVELSVQPLNPQRNPPPFPIPLFIKEAYCEAQDLPPPNGWISNLLVDEACRGRGYSKAIMLATEGIARKWGCTSISLHVDPDSSTGRVPQRLYERLGYKPVVVETDQKFLWMGPDVIRSGLYMVDGLPLLFLRKELL